MRGGQVFEQLVVIVSFLNPNSLYLTHKENELKIAISTDGNVVSAHFGRCPSFTMLEIHEGHEIKREVISNPGHHPGYLPKYFHDLGVTCIIAGGMGNRASVLFDQYGIQPIVGVQGEVQNVIIRLLDGDLKGGESLCQSGRGKGYGVDKTECDHGEDRKNHNCGGAR